ncbi:MAG: replication initiator protein A [Cetobacterium sp.]|uniref:replication initiator protein A n=1 Tax=Cetobacterium sp. TaxID=2071632 RepID=UPI002FC588EF
MSRMKIKDLKKLEFYQLPKWLFKVSGLKPVDIIIYTLAFNNWKLSVTNNLVNENDEIYFFMTHEGIREEIEIGKDQVIDSIKRLVESKVIIQEKFKGKATRFYLEDDLNQIKFKDVKKKKTASRKKSSTENPTTVVGKNDYTSTENPTTNQSENTDINNTNLLNKTELIKTTIVENSISVDQLQDSSAISENIKNIRNYLLKNIKGINDKTCNNIIFSVKNLNIQLERVMIVVEYANKYQKQIGYICDALKYNWTIPKISDTKKEIGRGHGENSRAITMAKESKEAVMEYAETLEQLTERYNSLDENLKNEIDQLALEKALKINPVERMAKVLVRTRTRLEVLRQYIQEGKI